jgi:hypothetical protein
MMRAARVPRDGARPVFGAEQHPGRPRRRADAAESRRFLPRYDSGGATQAGPNTVPPSGATPPAYLGATPMVQQLYQRFAGLPLEKLQQLAVMMPPSSMQGQMIQRALHAKQMAPAATGAFPNAAPLQIAQDFPTTAGQAPAQARGGGIPRRDSGGASGSSPTLGPATPSVFQWISGRGDFGLPSGSPGFPAPNGPAPSPPGGSTPPVWETDPMGRGIMPPGLTPMPIGGAPAPSSQVPANLPSSLTDGSWARSLNGPFGGAMFSGGPRLSASSSSSGAPASPMLSQAQTPPATTGVFRSQPDVARVPAASRSPMSPSPAQPTYAAGSPNWLSGIGNAYGWGGSSFGGSPFGSAFYGGGFPFSGSSFGGTGFARSGASSVPLPMMSFSPGNPGQVGPTWAPGQPLLSPSSPITTTPPGFGTPETPPLVTPLPPSVLAAAAAPAAAPSSPSFPGLSSAQSQQLQQQINNGQLAWNGRAYVDPTNPLAMDPNSNFAQGGEIPRRAQGGFEPVPSPERAAGFALRRSTAELESPVAGRTDDLPLAVAPDSHVIPADVVSGIGEGNSLNGAHLLDQMFHGGPWGVRAAKVRGPGTLPRPPRPVGRSRGGPPSAATGAPERTTPILAAGGEYVVRPEAVAHFGAIAKRRDPRRFARKSAIEAGHDAIDDFIVRARKHIVATTKKLPGPVKE